MKYVLASIFIFAGAPAIAGTPYVGKVPEGQCDAYIADVVARTGAKFDSRNDWGFAKLIGRYGDMVVGCYTPPPDISITLHHRYPDEPFYIYVGQVGAALASARPEAIARAAYICQLRSLKASDQVEVVVPGARISCSAIGGNDPSSVFQVRPK